METDRATRINHELTLIHQALEKAFNALDNGILGKAERLLEELQCRTNGDRTAHWDGESLGHLVNYQAACSIAQGQLALMKHDAPSAVIHHQKAHNVLVYQGERTPNWLRIHNDLHWLRALSSLGHPDTRLQQKIYARLCQASSKKTRMRAWMLTRCGGLGYWIDTHFVSEEEHRNIL